MIRIVDASVVVKWLVAEPDSDRAARIMRLPLVAPESLIPECLSALRKRVRRGLMIEQDAKVAAHLLARSGIAFEPVQPLAADILELSLRLSLSTYDCAYLAVARKLDGILITADQRLVARCHRPDAADLASRVEALSADPPMVQEPPPRAYIARRKAA
jgi:predicted nucleic acid-binding protein